MACSKPAYNATDIVVTFVISPDANGKKFCEFLKTTGHPIEPGKNDLDGLVVNVVTSDVFERVTSMPRIDAVHVNGPMARSTLDLLSRYRRMADDPSGDMYHILVITDPYHKDNEDPDDLLAAVRLLHGCQQLLRVGFRATHADKTLVISVGTSDEDPTRRSANHPPDVWPEWYQQNKSEFRFHHLSPQVTRKFLHRTSNLPPNLLLKVIPMVLVIMTARPPPQLCPLGLVVRLVGSNMVVFQQMVETLDEKLRGTPEHVMKRIDRQASQFAKRYVSAVLTKALKDNKELEKILTEIAQLQLTNISSTSEQDIAELDERRESLVAGFESALHQIEQDMGQRVMGSTYAERLESAAKLMREQLVYLYRWGHVIAWHAGFRGDTFYAKGKTGFRPTEQAKTNPDGCFVNDEVATQLKQWIGDNFTVLSPDYDGLSIKVGLDVLRSRVMSTRSSLADIPPIPAYE